MGALEAAGGGGGERFSFVVCGALGEKASNGILPPSLGVKEGNAP